MYVFIDPGESTGWTIFDVDGNEVSMGTCRGFDDLFNWLESWKLNQFKRVIIEEFKLYPWKSNAQMWSQFFTVEVIGAVRFKSSQFNIPFEKVPSRNKDMGFKYMGTTEPSHSNPLNHQLVAMAHGIYWLQVRGIRKPQAR